MRLNSRGRGGRAGVLTACLVLVTLVVAACSSGSTTKGTSAASSSSTPSTAGSPAATGGSAAAIDAAYTALLKGTWTAPPTDSSPAVPNKTVMMISCGQANDNCTDMGRGVNDAAKILGWKVILCDGALDPVKAQACFRQAASQKVAGIVNLAWDCPIVKSVLQQAVSAGIRVVGIHAFDCGQVNTGEKNLFTDFVSYGSRSKSQPDAWRAWGGAMAVAALKASKGGAILYPNDSAEFASFKFMGEGWHAKVTELCPGCKVYDLPWTVSEAGPKLTAKIQAALLQHPDVTSVSAAVNPALGFLDGVQQSGKASSVAVVEGHGSVTEGDWIRTGKMAALIGWPVDWWGYAALDTLNSAFAGTPAADQGIGFAIIDKANNLYPSGEPFLAKGVGIDLSAAYTKRWGK